jgi:hypothetical protein
MTATTTLTHPADASPEALRDASAEGARRPLLYKVADAMRVLRMSRSVIYEQIRAGRLRTVKQGRATFITAAALADYITLLEQEAGAAQ